MCCLQDETESNSEEEQWYEEGDQVQAGDEEEELGDEEGHQVQAGDGEEEQGDEEGDQVQAGDVEASGGSAVPRQPRRFRKSHCVKPPHVPSTPEQRRLISPVGDR